jgi:uncharacterized lipoprotein YmbA
VIAPETAQQGSSQRRDIVIGVGPVEISNYLDRPQIITGVGINEYKISELDRWAGNLRSNISAVVAENISIVLSTDRVYVYPWKQSVPIDYKVELNIIRFHKTSDGDVMLRAHWAILEADGKKPLLFRMSKYNEGIEGQGYDALITAKSRMLANLSREIADAIRSMNSGTQGE